MNKLVAKLLPIAALVCSVLCAEAQIVSGPGALSTNGNFVTTAVLWFGTDTGYRWNGSKGYFQAGAVYENQVNVAQSLEVGLTLKSLSTNTALSAMAREENAGIAGTILKTDAELAYLIDAKDCQIQLGAGGGYDKMNRTPFGDVVAEIQKKVSATAHMFFRVDSAIADHSHGVPEVSGGFGGSFY